MSVTILILVDGFLQLNYYDSYINESLDNIDNNKVINNLMTLEYDDSSILGVILRLINNEEALR